MFTHGIITPTLFLIAGVIYDRAHHREIEGFGGLAKEMPEYSGLTGLAFFASLGCRASPASSPRSWCSAGASRTT